MKKLMFVSLIVIVLALAGCNNVVTPEPTVVEPTLPKEEPTQIPTPVEEATEVPAPTEEPTAIPTEEPTPEPLPDRCPEVLYEVPEDLGEWTLNLGEYGIVGFTDGSSGELSFVLVGSYGNIVKKGEKDISSLVTDGGSFSFRIPSKAFIYIEGDLTIKVDQEPWIGSVGTIATSSTGQYLISANSEVEIFAKEGQDPEKTLLYIFFLSGKPVEFTDIDISILESKTTSMHCQDLLWEVTVSNANQEELEVNIGSKYSLLFAEEEPVGSILNMKGRYFKEDQEFVEFSGEFAPGIKFTNLELSIILKENSQVKFFILDYFSRNK